MTTPDWIWVAFTFSIGCCVGSFLNVVIYRLPLDKSLVSPRSSCPACGKLIRFYDNIPLVSWLLLRAKCRYCKASISPRYFIIELLTGLVFAGLFICYFYTDIRPAVSTFLDGGWLVYLLYIILLSGLIASSAIDLQLWVIPISICWFLTVVAIVGSAVGGYVINPDMIRDGNLLPVASIKTGSIAVGATVGLVIALVLLGKGLIKRSYELEEEGDGTSANQPEVKGSEPEYNHRLESFREIIFLLPIIICSLAAFWVVGISEQASSWFEQVLQYPVVSGVLGSLFGYFAGCGIVWATRILGTFGFGKEAMGLGDVHLMGAAGALIGWKLVIVAFFIAPFFGLVWAGFQMFFKKIRQIPYGPFLSLAVFAVMILNDWISRLLELYFTTWQ